MGNAAAEATRMNILQPTEQTNRPATDVVTDKGVPQSDIRVCHCEAVSPLASAGNVNAHCCCLQCPHNTVRISSRLVSSGQSDTRLVSLSVYPQSLSGECVTAVISASWSLQYCKSPSGSGRSASAPDNDCHTIRSTRMAPLQVHPVRR